MPKKPIKLGYKIWCCSCSCCGYPCTFQVYNGRPSDPETDEKVAKKGLVSKVVSHLVAPFSSMNHDIVYYCDNFFTSGPLVEMLSKNCIFVVGTIRKRALGFPAVLKVATPTAGTYVSKSVSRIQYFAL